MKQITQMDGNSLNIEVIVRIRPFLKETEKNQQFILPIDISNNAIKIFTAETQQQEIFEYILPNLMQSLEGYNFTLFAYGQTASGKTFSMLGPDGRLSLNEQFMGIIPRACQFLFSQISKHTDSFQIKVTFFEIYQNKMKDLMNSNFVNGDMSLLESKEVRSTQQIMDIIQQGSLLRATCKTDLNEHSSRSHAILQIKIERRQKIDQKQFRNFIGLLNLIDLAGSEDITRSNVKDQNLKEAVNINCDLFHLHRVFKAIQNCDKHIPFRDSTLTFILQPYLEGNSRTYFMTHVSPEPENLAESCNTLRQAILASRIKTKNYVQIEIQKNLDPMLNDYPDPYNYGRQTCTIDTIYGKVFARISGFNQHNEKLILFVHGSSSENSSMWWNYFTNQLLQQSRFFIVSIDCPGYGRSEGDKQTIRSYPCQLLQEVIGHLGYNKAYCLIGSSQGAAAVFNSIVQDSQICDFFAVVDPVSHDPNRFNVIKQPCLLIYDTEDDGHPVKVGRIVKNIIKHCWYKEFTNSQEPQYLKKNFISLLLHLFSTFDQQFENNQKLLLSQSIQLTYNEKQYDQNKETQQKQFQQILYTKYMTLRGGVLSWSKPYGREKDWYNDSNEFLEIQSFLENQAFQKENNLFQNKKKEYIPKEVLKNCSICSNLLEGLLTFDIPICGHRVCEQCSKGTLAIDNQVCPTPNCQIFIDPPIKIKKQVLSKNQIFIKFGNLATNVKSRITYKSYISDPFNAVKIVAFDINPDYPKAAIKVLNPPFELERTLDYIYPCFMTIKWKNDAYNPLTIYYNVQNKYQKFEKTLLINFLSTSNKKQQPISYVWEGRNAYISEVNIQ